MKIGFADTNFNTLYNHIVTLVYLNLHMRWLQIDPNLNKLLDLGISCHILFLPLLNTDNAIDFFLASSIFALP